MAYTLSIIITAHNIAPYITRCLNSVLDVTSALDEQAYEVLLIDDASSDDTATLLQQFAARYPRYHYHRVEFRNIGKVRNYALQLSRQDYVAFIDGDDTVNPAKFLRVIEDLQVTHPDIYITKINEIRNGKAVEKKRLRLTEKPVSLDRNAAIRAFLIHKDFQAHFPSKLFRRSLVTTHVFPEFDCYEDARLFPLLLSRATRVFYSELRYYNYIKRAESLSSQITDKKINQMAEVIREMYGLFGQQFYNLVSCHALELLLKYRTRLTEPNQRFLLEKVEKISIISFLLDKNIRTSFKHKYVAFKFLKQ